MFKFIIFFFDLNWSFWAFLDLRNRRGVRRLSQKTQASQVPGEKTWGLFWATFGSGETSRIPTLYIVWQLYG